GEWQVTVQLTSPTDIDVTLLPFHEDAMARTSPARWLRASPLVEALGSKEAPGSLSLGLLSPDPEALVLHYAGQTASPELSRLNRTAESPVAALGSLWHADLHPAWRWDLPVQERNPASTASQARQRQDATQAVFADPADPFGP